MKRSLLWIFLVTIVFLPVDELKKEETVVPEITISEVVSNEYGQLGKAIDRILQDKRLSGTTTGVSIRHASTGEVIYNHLGDTRLHPASSIKLLTGAAALEALGEEFRFKTEVLSDGIIQGNVLHGDIYLKGKGDPTLLKEDFDALARNLKEKGVRQINGNLIGDDTWYDNVRLSPDITWSDEPYYYAAQVSALTASPNKDFDAGTVIVEAFPNKTVGNSAIIKVYPETEVMKVINRSTTVGRKVSRDITITRQHGTNNIIIEGTIPVESNSEREWITVWEPSLYALDLFAKSLRDQGILFSEQPVVALGKTPEKAGVLTFRESIPLKELFIPFMKLSNNGVAEVLAKEMGKSVHGVGSWKNGLKVIEEYAGDAGLNKDMIQLRDASGMSYISTISANELSRLLYEVQKEPWYHTFLTSLPVARNSDRFIGGTLRNRVNMEGNIKAKTGRLLGVSSITGYAETKDGEIMTFSILINNHVEGVKPVEDLIVSEITNYKK